jgi:integrase
LVVLLDTEIPGTLFREHWETTRAGIVDAVRVYLKSRDSEHTIDWSYDRWKVNKTRPRETLEDGRRYLASFADCVAERMLSAIRRSHLLQWRDAMEKAGLSPQNINRHLRIVCAILRQGWLDAEIPIPNLHQIKLAEPEPNSRRAWTKEELLKALAELPPNTWAAWLFIIALTTGTRIGEPLAAKKEDYDPRGLIAVPKGNTKMRKFHALPILEMINAALAKHVATLAPGAYIFR